jgi:hypothetical protein
LLIARFPTAVIANACPGKNRPASCFVVTYPTLINARNVGRRTVNAAKTGACFQRAYNVPRAPRRCIDS